MRRREIAGSAVGTTATIDDAIKSRVGRDLAVRVRLPDSATTPSESSMAKQLVAAIRSVFNSGADIGKVEFLSFPAEDGEQMFVLSVTVPTLPRLAGHSSDQAQLAASITDASVPREGTVAHGVHKLAQKLHETLPAGVEIDPVSLDFGSIGISSVVTARLVTERDRRITEFEHISVPTGFARLLDTLTDEPHIYQLVVSNRGHGEFAVSVRVSLCHPDHQLSTDEGHARAIKQGRPLYPVAAFDDHGLTSNFRMMDAHLSTAYGSVLVSRNLDVTNRAAVRRLSKGYSEFRELLHGRMDFDQTYKELGTFPRFVVRERDLCHFVGLGQCGHDRPWADTPGRSPPAINEVELGQTEIATATDSTRSLSELSIPDDPSPKDGDRDHQAGTQLVAQILRERGFEAVVIDQDDAGSVPDLWALSPSGQVLAVEVENKNASKPASLLTNAIRADEWSIEMLVVGVTRRKAKKASNDLAKPFKDAKNARTQLYNRSQKVQTEDGSTVLLPQNTAEAEWWLTHDGTLQLECDGDIVANGPADESVSGYAHDLPMHREDRGEHLVVDATGTVQHRYDTLDSLEAEWSYLRQPLVPTRLHYLDNVQFKFFDDSKNLQDFSPQAGWDTAEHVKRYEAGLAEYFDTYTVVDADEQLSRDDVRRHALAWFNQLTTRKAPNNSYFEQCRPKYEEVEKKGISDGATKDFYYHNLTWRYPRGIVSPDLPDFSDGPNYPAEWDDKGTDAGEESGDGDDDRDDSPTES